MAGSVRSSSSATVALVAALLASACTETLDPIVGTTSLGVELLSPWPGTEARPLEPAPGPVTLRVRALGADGEVDEGFTREVDVYAHYLGGLSPELGARTGALASIPLEAGRSEPVDVELPAVYGPTFLWVEDGQGDDATFATGTTPVLWFRDPFLADVSRPIDETVGDGALQTSPLEGKQIHVSASRGGASGRIVVTGIYAQGYTVSDVLCQDDDATPPCQTGDYDSVFVFSFSKPRAADGGSLEVGDTLDLLTGSIGEFNGLTEVNFPQGFRGGERDAARVPAATVVDPAWLASKIELERLEAALIEVDGGTICPLDANYAMYGQWKLDLGDGCGDDTFSVVTKGQVNDFDPADHIGEALDVVGTLRPVNTNNGSFNVWILYPRSIDDLVLP